MDTAADTVIRGDTWSVDSDYIGPGTEDCERSTAEWGSREGKASITTTEIPRDIAGADVWAIRDIGTASTPPFGLVRSHFWLHSDVICTPDVGRLCRILSHRSFCYAWTAARQQGPLGNT